MAFFSMIFLAISRWQHIASIVTMAPSIRLGDRAARDDRALAPRWVPGVLALAIAQPRWKTKDFK